MNISDEERERRRQHMIRLHQEGRAGAEFGKMGGRPRKPRASEQIAEKVAQHAEEYFERMHEIILEGGEKTAIAAFKALTDLEERERKIIVEEEDKIDQLRREELIAHVQQQLSDALTSGIITVGDAEVIRDEGLTEVSEEPRGIEASSSG